MTAYIANHRKKNRIFRKREEELRHAILHQLDNEKIYKAAERLREAKFAVFKSRFSQVSVLPAHHFSMEQVAQSDPLARRWMSMTTQDIIEEYSVGDAETEKSTLSGASRKGV